MAQRTGLQTVLNLAHRVCHVYAVWRGSIIAAIDASSASTENKTLLKSALTAMDAACTAVDALRTVWES